jgi:hypothetical protein
MFPAGSASSGIASVTTSVTGVSHSAGSKRPPKVTGNGGTPAPTTVHCRGAIIVLGRADYLAQVVEVPGDVVITLERTTCFGESIPASPSTRGRVTYRWKARRLSPYVGGGVGTALVTASFHNDRDPTLSNAADITVRLTNRLGVNGEFRLRGHEWRLTETTSELSVAARLASALLVTSARERSSAAVPAQPPRAGRSSWPLHQPCRS